QHIGRPELIDDPRFADAATRFENRAECVRLLDETFASHTLAEWRERLATVAGVWAPVQTAREVHDDPQVAANGYIPQVDVGEGQSLGLVANPVQFDEVAPTLRRAPEHGQHTEEVLLEMGVSWEEIAAYKESAAIL
ncbi:MAG TPA: CoA transferase, partial [Actinomycetota bacterium]|nr:CoA transferase [Actinomycetota bacterium]